MKLFWAGLFKAVRSRVFSHILVCYFVILVVLVSACGLSFWYARNASLESITERNTLVLESATKSISNVLQVIESFNSTLYANTRLQSFMSSKNNKSVLYNASVLINELPQLYDSASLITGYFIYVPSVNYIVAPGQGFSNIQRYYHHHFALSSNKSYEQWHKEVLSGKQARFFTGYPESDSIQYSTLLASRTIGIEPCTVVYKLSGAKLLDMLTRPFSDTTQYAAIQDKFGNILYASKDYSTAEEKGFTRVSCNIASGELRVSILIPNRLISKQAAASVSSSLVVLLWMLGLGLLLIIITAVANMKPLMTIAEHAEEVGGKARGMWKINEAFKQAEEKSKELQSTLSLQKEFMKNACVNRLIYGNGIDGASLEEMLLNSGISIRGSRFYAVIISLTGESIISHTQVLELDILSRFSNRITVLAVKNEMTTLAMYNETEGEADERKKFFTSVYNALRENANLEATFFVGPVCESLDKLCDSFQVAAWLKSSSTTDTWLNLSSSVNEDENLSSIINESEQVRLRDKVLAGETDSVQLYLKEIEHDHFIQRSTHGFKRQYIYCRLVEILVSCGSSLNTREDLPADLMQMHSSDFFLWISERLTFLSEEAKNRRQIKSRQLGEKVFQYIDEHYDDYELTLGSLSAHLKVTSPYLSGLFKKQTGTNFSAYLEKVRISHAEELLKTEDINVDELAQKVGYISADSFRRAFKRVKGVTPSQYRDLQ